MDEARLIRVVVADSNRAVRYGIRAALRAASDIEVIGEAENDGAVLRLAHELRPHVIVIGLSMGGLRGADVIRALAPVLPEIRVVVFGPEGRHSADALAAGAAAFVPASAPEGRLLQAIRRAAATSEGKPQLGDYLVNHSLITPAQLEAALAWQRDLQARGRSAKLGELLQELGAISAADLERALRERA